MVLSEKKAFVLKYIRLGMDALSAMICAECTDEEISSLDTDNDFQRQIKLVSKLEEMRMLEGFERARANNLSMNDTRDTRWMLEKINPDRFGAGFKKSSGKNVASIRIDFGDSATVEMDGTDNVESFEGDSPEDDL